MKRRYKPGDWYRIPLGGETDALVVITRASGSRLFGYFFAWPASAPAPAARLKTLAPVDALLRALFGAEGIEDLRWPLIAASLPFETGRWPYPDFAARGTFGRTMYRCTYDPETLRLIRRTSSDAADVRGLPPARIARALDIEHALKSGIAKTEQPATLRVYYEVKDAQGLAASDGLPPASVVQFSRAFTPGELSGIAASAERVSDLEVRVHGAVEADIEQLLVFRNAVSLTLDCASVRNAPALRRLTKMRSLSLARSLTNVLAALPELPSLRFLRIVGSGASAEMVARIPTLRILELVDASGFDLRALAALPLERLLVAHGAHDAAQLSALAGLANLTLRDIALPQFPDMRPLVRLRCLRLEGVRLLRDLAPLNDLPALRELHVRAMPQLQVPDFEPLRRQPSLAHFTVDVQSRTKNREVYRLLSKGTSAV